MHKKTNDIDTAEEIQQISKGYNRIRSLLQKKVLTKTEFLKKLFGYERKVDYHKLLITIKSLGGDTENRVILTHEETAKFNIFFTAVGKNFADNLSPEEKTIQKIETSIACVQTNLAKNG